MSFVGAMLPIYNIGIFVAAGGLEASSGGSGRAEAEVCDKAPSGV
jgi:hypothetical protein